MVDPAALKYVKDLLRKGYPVETVRGQLRAAKYPSTEIDRLLSAATGFKLQVPIIGIGIFVIIVLLISSILWYVSTLPQNVSLSISVKKEEVQAGDALEFDTVTQSAKEVPVRIEYELISKDTGLIIALSTGSTTSTTTKTFALTVPRNAKTGTYELVVRAEHKGGTETQKQSITITAAPEASPPVTAPTGKETEDIEICPRGCDDFNKCTKDSCVRGTCQHETVASCCGNNTCEKGENVVTCSEDCQPIEQEKPTSAFEDAKELARSNQEQAAQLCASIPDPVDFDQCFVEISIIAEDSRLCKPVSDIQTRDSCYINFLLEGDTAVCEDISDSLLQINCYNMRSLSEYSE